MKRINLSTPARTAFLDITAAVQAAVAGLGLRDGVATVFVPHTTAGITLNEHADPDVMADMERTLERLVPWSGAYRHAEGNAAAHVKASLMGASVAVLVRAGRLQLGTWQGLFFCEFDGPRNREVWVSGP